MRRLFRDFLGDAAGTVAAALGFGAPVLAIGAMAAVEYGSLSQRRVVLQRAADAGALLGGQEMSVANASAAQVRSSVCQAVRSALALSAGECGRAGATTVTVDVPADRKTVSVSVSEAVVSRVGTLLRMPDEIGVRAVAKLSGNVKICMIALDDKQKGTLHLQKNARITAESCAIYSSSRDKKGLQGEDAAVARANLICSAGGFEGKKAQFSPEPLTECPTPSDPLAGRAPPAAASRPCTANDTVISGKTPSGVPTFLPGGVYCGGLKITDGAQIRLASGDVFVIRDGPLVVDNSASLTGEDVGFYFQGDKTGLLFDEDSSVSLAAPRSGEMAGLLFFEERTAPLATLPVVGKKGKAPDLPLGSAPMRDYRVTSNDARQLLGTIYLSNGRLIVDADKPVADLSAYTVVLAKRIELFDGPNLVLNSDYASSKVPVPKGVGPIGATVALDR